MEARIIKIEQELAIMAHTQQTMSDSLSAIASTLEKMSEIQLDTKLLEERYLHLDRDLQESFIRVHKRIDAEKDARVWTAKTVVAALVVIVTEFVIRTTT